MELLWLIPLLPFAGFLILVIIGSRISKSKVAIMGAGSVGLSMVMALITGISFISSPPANHLYSQTLWTWISISGFRPEIKLLLDPLSVVMILVITVVGFLIHLYSVGFMKEEEGYGRFFSYMNLFTGSMLTLVLADNLFLLYLGWEGVGLCSYLLIGFWYKDPANGYAARKAFVVTRIGDTALAIGLFIIYTNLGTLEIAELMKRAQNQWPVGSTLAVASAALILGGAVGKSAQLPLQTWLPDAMAGPTPVSALIHAATMVTAGVYLIARTHTIFILAPVVMTAVAVIGALTLLISGLSALTQKDIKRVLAYSTMSQIGYMFLALGIGAWSAAIFHFMTHAFFKALLFLGAGVVILGLNHEHNMFKMGGIRKELPSAFWSILIGSVSLSALPLIGSGFFSKDLILWEGWASEKGSPLLWGAGIAGALLTSLYTFRMVFLTFFGEKKSPVTKKPGNTMVIPLVILSFFSLVCGFIELPRTLGDIHLFSDFISAGLPEVKNMNIDGGTELTLMIISSLISLSGLYLAYLFFLRKPQYKEILMKKRPVGKLHGFLFSGLGFDRLYSSLFIKSFLWIARINRDDFIDLMYGGAAWYSRAFNNILTLTQTGKVRWYAAAIAFGAVITIAIAVFI